MKKASGNKMRANLKRFRKDFIFTRLERLK